MSVIEHGAPAFEPGQERQSERYRARVAAEADRGYRTQPLRRDNPSAAVTSLLAGLLADHAREERGAA